MGDAANGLDSCAEELLYLLHRHGVEHLFLNPGTDSAPLQEAAAALDARGTPIPRIVTSSFESVALAAAHGYFQLTRRPQAVFVHVDVGTQNLGAMVHNVLRDRAGVVVLAGKTPYGEDSSSPGGRSSWINWHQDVPDQAGILRSYAKWTFELTRGEDTARAVGRAVQVAGGGRAGLAYLMVSRDVLMEPPGPDHLRRTARYARPLPPAIEPGTLGSLVEWLLEAERPVIVTSRLGRNPEGARALGQLADLLAIPVVGRAEAMNLPTRHPMRIRRMATARRLLGEADLLVVVDCDVPWIPAGFVPAPDVKVVQIDDDPLKTDMPLWSFPVDVSVTADGALAVTQLLQAIVEARVEESAAVAARRRRLASLAAPDREAGAAPAGAAGVLRAAEVISALDGLLEPGDVVIEEAVSNATLVDELLGRSEPGTLCTAGGPGLGWCLGAAVGVKLARPDRRVVGIVGDGSFMFGVPTAALCLAAEAGAPFLAVVLDNDGYRASRSPVEELFPAGVSVARGDVIGTRFRQPPDFAALARACGAYGERVEESQRLVPALEKALAEIESGRSAVVDVAVADR